MGRVEYIATECCVCGKEYTQMVIDGHTNHIPVCGECLNDFSENAIRDSMNKYVEKGILG